MAYPHPSHSGPSGYRDRPQRERMGPQQDYDQGAYDQRRPYQECGYSSEQQYEHGGAHPGQYSHQQHYGSQGYQDAQYGHNYPNESGWGYESQGQHDYNDRQGNYNTQSYSGDHGYQGHSNGPYDRPQPQSTQHYDANDYAEPPKDWAKPQRSFSSGDAQGFEQQAANAVTNGHRQPSHGFQNGKSTNPTGNLTIPKRSGREKILTEPQSPKNLAWDNPFPVFPSQEKKKVANLERPSTASSGRSRESSRSFETQRSNGRSPARDPRRGDASARSSNYLASIDEAHSQQQSNPCSAEPSYDAPQWPVQHRPGSARGPQPSGDWHSGPPARSFTMPNQVPPVDPPAAMPIREKAVHGQSYEASQMRNFSQARPPQRQPTQEGLPQMRSSSTGSPESAQGVPSGPLSHPNSRGQSRQGSVNEWSGSADLPSGWQPYTRPGQQSLQSADEEEDMPNFEAAAPKSGKASSKAPDKELHLSPKEDLSTMRAVSGPQDRGRQTGRSDIPEHRSLASRSRSQPNFRGSGERGGNDYYGFDFGNGVKPPPVPQLNREQQSERRSFDSGSPRGNSTPQSIRQRNMGPSPAPSANYQQQQQPTGRPYGPGGPPPLNVARALASESARNSPMPSPVDRRTPVSATSRTMHPDSLPQHPLPAPTRPNVLQKSQTPVGGVRPPPVRQYTTPVQAEPQIAPPTPSPSADANQLVTHEELQQLRTTVNARPSDQSAQLLLAKKLVEATNVLADDQGHADAKTKAKNRDRFAGEAHRLVKKLVAHGNPEAMFFLADAQAALGLPKDPKEAFALYQNAAKLGHAQAAYRVAVCCELGPDEGGGTRRDAVKAIQWYERAAQLGDVPAMYKLGMIRLKGLLGQSRDQRAALPWLEKAAARADADNPHALHELALLHEGAAPGHAGVVAIDHARALQLFRRAAELGYKFAQYRLGAAHEHGSLGCPVDARQSVSWYSRAAAQAEHQSELALSGWYLTGAEGVLAQSDTEAYLWARKAAGAGLAKAEYAMGYFTEVGIGVGADLEAAKRWYWKAASQNFPKARERLEDLRRGGTRIQKSRVSRSTVQKSEGDCILM